MNTVFLKGYATQDFHKQTIGNKNTSCLNFTIGISQSFKNERGNIEKKSMFFNVVIYGQYAEKIQKIEKGDLVILQGKLNQDIWEKDGNKHSKVNIVASRINIFKKQTQQNNEDKLSLQEIQEAISQ